MQKSSNSPTPASPKKEIDEYVNFIKMINPMNP